MLGFECQNTNWFMFLSFTGPWIFLNEVHISIHRYQRVLQNWKAQERQCTYLSHHLDTNLLWITVTISITNTDILIPGILSLSTVNFLGQVVLFCVLCPVHWRMLTVSMVSTHLSPAWQKCPWTLLSVSPEQGRGIVFYRNHDSNLTIST